MKAAIAGVTGFIGSNIKSGLESLGWMVIPLLRSEFARDDSSFSELIDGCDVIINVAGVPVIKRQTAAYRKEIYDSRVGTTRKIVNAIKLAKDPPAQFVCASAVGIYSGSEVNTESSFSFGSDFMAQVCNDWENTAKSAEEFTGVTIARMGVVLDPRSGALKVMLLPFKMGLGAKVGSGNQMFSWIHSRDLINAYIFVIEGKKPGIYNFTSPGYLSNADYTKALGKALGKPTFFTVPENALKMIYGRGADTIISGQAAYPERLLQEGFNFQYPQIENALKDLLLKG
ncbi:MAG TPA: TIGR01777 family oxidoreductase [Lentimicrobium sp.]|nr:TIGR01777 family oxidoreductase [Lentimicrobium sp.]